MVSYKLEYLKCIEERENLKKEIVRLDKDLAKAYAELNECLKRDEAEKILRKAEEIANAKAEELLKDVKIRDLIEDEIINIVEDIFEDMSMWIIEKVSQDIVERLDEIITKAIEKRKDQIRKQILRALSDVIHGKIV
jgi:Glu-tRNA(Gln) amidotransferase subunit E-like FAD-binding protein